MYAKEALTRLFLQPGIVRHCLNGTTVLQRKIRQDLRPRHTAEPCPQVRYYTRNLKHALPTCDVAPLCSRNTNSRYTDGGGGGVERSPYPPLRVCRYLSPVFLNNHVTTLLPFYSSALVWHFESAFLTGCLFSGGVVQVTRLGTIIFETNN